MKRFGSLILLLLVVFPGGHCPAAPTVTEKVLEGAPSAIPELVAWSPRGDSVWVGIVDDLLGASTVTQILVDGTDSRVYPMVGTLRAFRVAPDEKMMATIHEQRENRIVQVWNTADGTAEEIHTDRWNLYFPLVNTVDPWQPSGERLVFYRAWLHERRLMLWTAAAAEVEEVTGERRSDRAFWHPNGHLLIPTGIAFERVVAGDGDPITGIIEVDPASGKEISRRVPEGFRAIFPYSHLGFAVIKDEVSPPLLLHLETWEYSPLPGTVERFLDLAWSPDGSRFAYPLNSPEICRIESFDVEKGRSSLVWVSDQHQAGGLSWSPSGKYLAGSFLDSRTRLDGSIIVLDTATGETVWSKSRDPHLTQRYLRRGRKSVHWHPSEDRLLLWDRVQNEDGQMEVEFRVIDFEG